MCCQPYYPVAADGTPTLADKGYVGAGIGIKVPIKGSKPDTGARSYNQVQAHLRAPAETANALLKGFKALKRVTLDPATITKITTTAQVILNLNNNLPRRERLNLWGVMDLPSPSPPKEFAGQLR